MPNVYSWKYLLIRWPLTALLLVGVYRETGLWTVLALGLISLGMEAVGWAFQLIATFLRETVKSETRIQAVLEVLKEAGHKKASRAGKDPMSGIWRAN